MLVDKIYPILARWLGLAAARILKNYCAIVCKIHLQFARARTRPKG